MSMETGKRHPLSGADPVPQGAAGKRRGRTAPATGCPPAVLPAAVTARARRLRKAGRYVNSARTTMLKQPKARLRSQRSRWRRTCPVLSSTAVKRGIARFRRQPELLRECQGKDGCHQRISAAGPRDSLPAPPAPVSRGATASTTAEPTGTHADHTPMAAPRLSGRNHAAMTAGARTAMKLVPMPSITRLQHQGGHVDAECSPRRPDARSNHRGRRLVRR